MKGIYTKIGFIALIMLILFSVQVYSVNAKFIMGDVQVKRNGKYLKVTTKTVFKDKDLLVTGPKSYIVLTTNNGDSIELKANSKLLIDLQLFEEGAVSLIEGKIIAKYNKIKKDTNRKIVTPTVVAAVRGTEFSVSVSESGSTRISMNEGSLDVSNPSGKKNISGNEKADIVPGSEPANASGVSDEQWVEQQNQNLENSPEQVAENYEQHIENIKKSSDSSQVIPKLEADTDKINSESDAEKFEENLDDAEEQLKDNMLLNRASAQAIDNIVSNYDESKADINSKFEKIKSESDKVAEQQEKDLKAIQEIREKYLKAKQEILDKHDDYVNQILNRTK